MPTESYKCMYRLNHTVQKRGEMEIRGKLLSDWLQLYIKENQIQDIEIQAFLSDFVAFVRFAEDGEDYNRPPTSEEL